MINTMTISSKDKICTAAIIWFKAASTHNEYVRSTDYKSPDSKRTELEDKCDSALHYLQMVIREQSKENEELSKYIAGS